MTASWTACASTGWWTRFGPAGDGTVLRNAYISNIRDDCVEADYLSAGRIEDSLLDGCYAGISVDPVTRPSPKNPEPLVLDGVLMRLKPFPNSPGRPADDPAVQVRGTGPT